MAGGGSGYGYNHGGNFDGGEINGGSSGADSQFTCTCESLCIDTILNSPQEDILAILEVGDVLAVKENAGRLLAHKDDNLAGSLTPPTQAKIINCISSGHKYVAVVKEKTGGACKVQIRPEG